MPAMLEIRKSETFDAWLSRLERQTKTRIAARIDRLAAGNPGDVAAVGSGVSEMRLHFGAGYRVYFLQHGPVIVVLLCGGDKSTQSADIKRAVRMAEEWRHERIKEST